MSQVMRCLFTISDELVAFEVPIYKRWKRVMNVDILLYYQHINFDVSKVLKMSPHLQRWWDKCPLIFNPRQNTVKPCYYASLCFSATMS